MGKGGGRPKLNPHDVVVFAIGNMRLRRGREDDLIEFLQGQAAGRVQAAIKAAMRNGITTTTAVEVDEQAAMDEMVEGLAF